MILINCAHWAIFDDDWKGMNGTESLLKNRTGRFFFFFAPNLYTSLIKTDEIPKWKYCTLRVDEIICTKIMQFRVKGTVHRPVLGLIPDWPESQKFARSSYFHLMIIWHCDIGILRNLADLWTQSTSTEGPFKQCFGIRANFDGHLCLCFSFFICDLKW